MQHLIYRIFEVLPKIFLHHLFAHIQKRITKPIHQKNKLHCVVRFSDIVQRLKLTGKSLLHHQQHFLLMAFLQSVISGELCICAIQSQVN